MWNTIKDYLHAAFYVLGAVALVILTITMGMIVIIPALMYGTYKILQIRRQIRNQQPKEIRNVYYTTSNSNRTRRNQD